MNSTVYGYVKYRVERSEEAFRVARRSLDAGDLHEAVGRLYYACFHMVSSLLLLEGYSAGRHQGIWTLFDLHCIKTDRFPREIGRFFHRLYRRRQDADYVDHIQFERTEVEDWFREAQDFCARPPEKRMGDSGAKHT